MTYRLIRNVFLIFAVVCFTGCGGGGGGGSTPATPVARLVPEAPSITGLTGQDVSVPIKVEETGSVASASFDLTFNDGVFEPVSGTRATASETVQGLPTGTICRYKWLDSHTLRVVYASSSDTQVGNTLVNIPLKVKSESDTGLTVVNATVNQ
ncbi:MAG: cohesin domain-containing protein [Armatimonadota bacterium]|nr:hypothetical protein [bacterium]